MKIIKAKLTKSIRDKLRIGQEILYSGTIYTARDQAHKRLNEAIRKKKKLPIDLKDCIIYYCGPGPSKFKEKVGSAGPTTSSRMDKFTPVLLNAGVGALIGKGNRSKEVVDSIRRNKAVYFLAMGGAGAYLGKRIKQAKIVAYRQLGAEAIYEMQVKDFPLIVGIDARGKNIYKDKKGE